MNAARSRCLIVFIVLLLAMLSAGVVWGSQSDGAGSRETRYDVFSHGLKIGEVKTVCAPVVREQRKTYRFESSTHIDADFLLFSYNLDKKEEAMIGRDGTFNYRRTTQENGKTVHVSGRMENRAFRFTIDENGSRRTLIVPRETYDFTTLDCPEVSMGPGEAEKSLRVLDLENLTVVNRKYRWVRDENVAVAGRNIPCKVIDFQDTNKKGRRWVEEDSLGVLITRQEGRGNGVSYSSRLTSLVVRPGPDSL